MNPVEKAVEQLPYPDGATRYQRVAIDQQRRALAREIITKQSQRAAKRNRRSRQEVADRLDPDGRWRDNLGESPDV